MLRHRRQLDGRSARQCHTTPTTGHSWGIRSHTRSRSWAAGRLLEAARANAEVAELTHQFGHVTGVNALFPDMTVRYGLVASHFVTTAQVRARSRPISRRSRPPISAADLAPVPQARFIVDGGSKSNRTSKWAVPSEVMFEAMFGLPRLRKHMSWDAVSARVIYGDTLGEDLGEYLGELSAHVIYGGASPPPPCARHTSRRISRQARSTGFAPTRARHGTAS